MLVVAALGLSACGSTPPKPLANDRPARILQLAEAAVDRSRGVHVVATVRVNGLLRLTETIDSGRQDAIEHVAVNGGHAQIRDVGGTIYLKAGATFYDLAFLDPTSPLVGKWARVPSSLSAYDTLEAGLRLPSPVADIWRIASLHKHGPVVVDGRHGEVVSGSLVGVVGVGGPVSVDVAVHGALPLFMTAPVASGTSTGVQTSTFTHWGERVTVAAPGSSVEATKKDF